MSPYCVMVTAVSDPSYTYDEQPSPRSTQSDNEFQNWWDLIYFATEYTEKKEENLYTKGIYPNLNRTQINADKR